ncbi:MAG: Ribokinase-like protein [Benjaminiella poitrasii]|nr:MAG: Ribokinase-like protein [Benjaminiella poitrasii]
MPIATSVGRPLIVIGGIALDITATVGKATSLGALSSILHTSTPGHVKQSLGGVGRNVAEAAWRTGGTNVKLVSVVGDDLAGQSIQQGMRSIGMNTEYIQILKSQPTAVYNALHSNDGQLIAAVADMNIFDSMDTSRIISILKRENPNFVCFDGNISSIMMKTIAQTCQSLSIPALFEPTSVPKSLKLFEFTETTQAQSIQYASPNQFELEAMCDTIQSNPILSKKKKVTSIIPDSIQLKNAPRLANSVLPHVIYLSNYIPNIITKLGEEGCLYVGRNSVIEYFPPEFIEANEIKSVTGAGDCFVGTLIANLQQLSNMEITSTDMLKLMIQKSQQSSIRTLKSNNAVSEKISKDLLLLN